MFSFGSEVVIDRPAGEIGHVLGDFARYPEWTDMSESRQIGDGPVGVGTRGQGTIAAGPARFGMTWEITDFDPQRVVAYRTISNGALSLDGDYRLEPLGPTSTRVTARGVIRTRGVLRLLEPFLRSEIRRNEEGELGRLKALLEDAAEAAPSLHTALP